MGKKLNKRVPKLRFPEFYGDWLTDRIDHFLVRYVNPVDVQLETKYKQIGIRSHGKGIFHKDPVTGKELGNKRVYWVHPQAFVVNIVFAWEQAVALTSNYEEGYVASHRFLMFLPKDNKVDLKFALLFFLRKRGKGLLELASPGGAGRNKTLGQDNFAELKITLPQREEQEKIASFLGAVDARLTQLRRKRDRLQTYKRGVMQKIFSQEMRFRDAIGSGFPDWEEKTLEQVAKCRRGSFPQPYGLDKWYDDNNGEPFVQVYDVDDNLKLKSSTKRRISAEAMPLSVYVKQGSIVLTIQGSIGRIAITQYDCYVDRTLLIFTNFLQPTNKYFFVHIILLLFEKEKEKAPGGTIKTITKESLSIFNILIPCMEEQEKIADFLSAIDQKIEAISRQSDQTEQFKKGLLQKMFV